MIIQIYSIPPNPTGGALPIPSVTTTIKLISRLCRTDVTIGVQVWLLLVRFKSVISVVSGLPV